MPTLGLETSIVDESVYRNTLARFRETGVVLPTLAELTEPATISREVRASMAGISPHEAHALNLFRIHWFNDSDPSKLREVPDYVVLPSSLTGVAAKIVVLPADRFPMIQAHKVLASYGCLVPRLVTGQFDPTKHRAVWPSTGNYCRGGVAVSRILGCRGVAVLPQGMSRERFEWLENWVGHPSDVIRTPGTESNVREIYEKCADLDRDPENIIFNQFSEFGNYLVHYHATGKALERVVEHLQESHPDVCPRAFVSATGSGGTLAAGDYLKQAYGSSTVAVEALQCPTLLYNGFGEHNIQGIGDKHVPLIHNVMATDFVTAVSDEATDRLLLLFNTEAGRDYLADRRGIPEDTIEQLPRLGLSSICNILAAIKSARYLNLGDQDLVLTVATDGASMYASEHQKILGRDFPRGFDALAAAEVNGQYLLGAATDHLRELCARDRDRIFNLGYFTWVEQQGLSIEQFEERRHPAFWRGLLDLTPAWDSMIEEMNAKAAVS